MTAALESLFAMLNGLLMGVCFWQARYWFTQGDAFGIGLIMTLAGVINGVALWVLLGG